MKYGIICIGIIVMVLSGCKQKNKENKPNMDRSDFIKSAKALYPAIVFFILSGHDINEKINHLIEIGMVKKYYRKPFNLKEIGEEIEAVIPTKA